MIGRWSYGDKEIYHKIIIGWFQVDHKTRWSLGDNEII
jgi:hypothetical protein